MSHVHFYVWLKPLLWKEQQAEDGGLARRRGSPCSLGPGGPWGVQVPRRKAQASSSGAVPRVRDLSGVCSQLLSRPCWSPLLPGDCAPACPPPHVKHSTVPAVRVPDTRPVTTTAAVCHSARRPHVHTVTQPMMPSNGTFKLENLQYISLHKKPSVVAEFLNFLFKFFLFLSFSFLHISCSCM